MQQAAQSPETLSGDITHDPVASQAEAQQHSANTPSVMLQPAASQPEQLQPVPQPVQHVVVQHTMQQQRLPASLMGSVQQPAATSQPAQGCVTASAALLPESPPQSKAAG